RDVAGARIDAVEIPARLARLREMIDQEAAAILAREDAGEAPGGSRQISQIEEIDDEQVAGLGAFDAEGSGEIMHFGEIDIAHIVGAVVILDLAAGPVEAFDAELVARLEHLDHGNVGMPAIMRLHFGDFWRPRQIDFESRPGHGSLSLSWSHLLRGADATLLGAHRGGNRADPVLRRRFRAAARRLLTYHRIADGSSPPGVTQPFAIVPCGAAPMHGPRPSRSLISL